VRVLVRSLAVVIASVAAAPAVAMFGLGLAYADPGQTCTQPVWVTGMFGVPIGSRTTCFNPDGSYQMCTSLGTAGNGPGTCINYPAAPAPASGGLVPLNPPVPGMPPPPPPPG
jgi:hypothetical protein